MANTAAQNLAALNQEVEGVEDAATALSRIQPENDVEQAPGDTAEFGTPEAIATAVVASVILGPVGGVLVGGMQGWLAKKRDQGLLDTMAAEKNVLTASADGYTDLLNGFRESATSPEDIDQINVLQKGLDVAREMMLAPDKAMRAKGVAIMDGVDAGMQTYTRNQETDRIALEAEVKDDKRQLGLDAYARYDGMRTDFDNKSTGYLARQQAGNVALTALQDGSPAQLHSAMILFNKALDPGSAVLGEERNAITEMGSLLDTVYNFFGEKFTGQKLNADQRRDIGAAIMTILDESTEFQLQREARFGQRAIEDLAPKYVDRFTLVEDIPAAEPLDIPDDVKNVITQPGGLTGLAQERLVQFVADKVDRAKQERELIDSSVSAVRDFMVNTGENIGTSVNEALDFLTRDRPEMHRQRPTN